MIATIVIRDIIICHASESENPQSSIISIVTFPISPGITVACFLTASTTTIGGLTNYWDACYPLQVCPFSFPVGSNLLLNDQIDLTHDKAQQLTFAVGGEMGSYAVHVQCDRN